MATILSSIKSAYSLSDIEIHVLSNPSIVFLSQTPFYSQPIAISSWWLVFFGAYFEHVITCVSESKQKQVSGWGGLFNFFFLQERLRNKRNFSMMLMSQGRVTALHSVQVLMNIPLVFLMAWGKAPTTPNQVYQQVAATLSYMWPTQFIHTASGSSWLRIGPNLKPWVKIYGE